MNHGGGLYSPQSAPSPPRSRKVFFSPQRRSDHSGFAASLFSLGISSLLVSSLFVSCTPLFLPLFFLSISSLPATASPAGLKFIPLRFINFSLLPRSSFPRLLVSSHPPSKKKRKPLSSLSLTISTKHYN